MFKEQLKKTASLLENLQQTSSIWKDINSWKNLEVNNLKSIIKDPLEQILNNTHKEDIYFLAWVKPNLNKRACDNDILFKNYFLIDIDIRNNMQSLGLECTNNEIIEEGKDIWKYLQKLEQFKDRQAIVFSWNGLHIYYVWKPQRLDIEIRSVEYKLGVQQIYEEIESYLWNNPAYKIDYACSNVWRIARLPYTVNSKNLAVTKIIEFRENKKSTLLEKLVAKSEVQLFRQFNKDVNRRKEAWLEYIGKNKKLDITNRDKDNFKYINENIEAWRVAEKILPNFKFDWKKNFLNEKRWYTWYFYSENLNAIINWWSRHFAWWSDSSWWSPTNIIRNQFDYSWWEVLNWFDKEFKNLKLK